MQHSRLSNNTLPRYFHAHMFLPMHDGQPMHQHAAIRFCVSSVSVAACKAHLHVAMPHKHRACHRDRPTLHDNGRMLVMRFHANMVCCASHVRFELPSPPVAVRNLVEHARFGHLCTAMCDMHHRRAGYPFGTLVDFATDGAGYPIFCLSPLAIHSR